MLESNSNLERKVVRGYVYQREKVNKIDYIDKDSFVLSVTLFEEKKVFSTDSVLIEYHTDDVREVYLQYPTNEVPEKFKFFLNIEDKFDTYELDKNEFNRLADKELTDQYAFVTYKLV